MKTIPDFKRGVPDGTVRSNVVGKLSKKEQMSPIVLLIVTEDVKELFNFLIYAFCFTICLRMEGHGQGLVYIKLAPSFSHKFGSKLGTSVGNYML